MSKDAITLDEGNNYIVLQQPTEEIHALIKTNLGDETISRSDLDVAINPSGKSTKWEIAGLGDDSEMVNEIEGVIVAHQRYRVYWKDEYSGSSGANAPDCISRDMLTGEGEPGGECASCPFNEWDSGANGSKACSERRRIFVLRPGEMLPTILTASPVNVGAMKTYGTKLISKAQKRYTQVISKLRLEPAVSKSGFDYAKMVISMVSPLPPEEAQKMEAYAHMMKPYLLDLEIDDTDAEPF